MEFVVDHISIIFKEEKELERGSCGRVFVEFVADACQSFLKEKKDLERGACTRLVKEILTWIKMLLIEEGMLPFEPINMVK
jgi:hypothetical protein